MNNYLVRIQLNNIPKLEHEKALYEQLHKAMEAKGYVRQIHDGALVLALPHAEYGLVQSPYLLATSVVGEIERIVKKIHNDASITAVKIIGPVAYSGLKAPPLTSKAKLNIAMMLAKAKLRGKL